MSDPATATDVLICMALVLVGVTATVAASTTDPVRQAAVLGVLGLSLSLLFLVLQAPDVGLSELVVGTALTPLLILLTVRKVKRAAPPPPDPQDPPAQDGGADRSTDGGSGA